MPYRTASGGVSDHPVADAGRPAQVTVNMDLNPRRRTRRVVGEHRGGADDYFIPQSDTMVFDGRANTDVHLIPGTGHCAMSKAAEMVPMVIGWLRREFYGS